MEATNERADDDLVDSQRHNLTGFRRLRIGNAILFPVGNYSEDLASISELCIE